MAIPREYSTRQCWRTGRTREPTNVVASNWPAVAGPGIPLFLVTFGFHRLVDICQSGSYQVQKGMREVDRVGRGVGSGGANVNIMHLKNQGGYVGVLLAVYVSAFDVSFTVQSRRPLVFRRLTCLFRCKAVGLLCFGVRYAFFGAKPPASCWCVSKTKP